MIELLFITSFFCCGLKLLTSADFDLIFSFVGNWYARQNKTIKLTLKPVIGCISCMASFWGILSFQLSIGISLHNIHSLIPFLFGLAFVNTFLYITFYYIHELYSEIIQVKDQD